MRVSIPACLASLLTVSACLADHQHSSSMEEVYVESRQSGSETIIATPSQPVTDSAELLQRAAGANLNRNGPLTGLVQFRGLHGQRVSTEINGSHISSGGPNLMDSALHYAPAALLEDLVVYRGIAPVSVGQETLGGAIRATTWRPAFGSNGELESSGKITGSYGSANDATEWSGIGALANRNHRLGLALLEQRGNDTEFDGGKIRPSSYARKRGDLSYGFQSGSHSVSAAVFYNETGNSGTPALPMDIRYIDTLSGQVEYLYDDGNWGMDYRMNVADVEHEMANFHMRTPGANLRSTLATGDSYDAELQFWWERPGIIWRAGLDGHHSEHSADISDPGNAMFYIDNFNDARKTIAGIYAEMASRSSKPLQYSLGVRVNQVNYRAGRVNATPAEMGNAAAVMLRNRFNNGDRKDSDYNTDAVLSIDYKASDNFLLVSSIGIKNRSADYQQRYLWLPMQATAGLADGNTYIGNLDLDPETSREIVLGFDYNRDSVSISPRFFYRDIDNYIQGTPVTDAMIIAFSTMMGDPTPLQFNNLDARLFGADVEAQWTLNPEWQLSLVLSYVEGKRKDIDEDLYRVAPFNGLAIASYQHNNGKVSFEVAFADDQHRVAETNNEPKSAGYATFNLRATQALSDELELAVGLENLADKYYEPHLGGVNRAMGSDVAVGDRLPGTGRNAYAKLSLVF